jgi:hypothetical protein
MTSLLLSERAPLDWGLHPELATILDRRGTSAENAQKRDSLGDSPASNWDPALSAKVTTGGLSAPSPDGRWDATSYGLMGPGLLSMHHFLASMLRSLRKTIMAEKQKVIFLLDSGAHFSVSPFSHWYLVQLQKLPFGANLASPWRASLPGLWPALGETSSSIILFS